MKPLRNTLSLLIVSAIIAGCSANTDEPADSNEPQDNSATTAEGSTEQREIEWWMWGTEEEEAGLQQIADLVTEKNPDIKVNLTVSPWGDYFTKLTTNLASGDVACITSMNGPRLSTYAEAFSELSEEDLQTAGIDKANYGDGSLDILAQDGKLLGIPYDVATMVLYYNKDAFEAAGVDAPTNEWTIDDFEDAAKKITAHGDMKGFGISPAEFQWLALPIAKSGVQPINENGELDLTNEKLVDAATWYSGLVTDLQVANPVASASDVGWGESQFSNGNAAMAVDGTWNAVSYITDNEQFDGGVVRLPRGENGPLSMVLGSGYGIGAKCEGADREAALKAIGTMVSKEGQDIIGSTGRSLPANIQSQDTFYDSLPEESRDEIQAALSSAFDGAQAQRTSSQWSKVSEAFPQSLVGVYNNQTSMKDALTDMQSQFNR